MAACPQEFIDFAEALAERARAVALEYFRKPLSVETKSDSSPVTLADRASEAAMREMITAGYPQHGVIGEEQGADKSEAEFVWVIDPIDGTKRFITGNVLFGSLIALTQGGKPILGVIEMPALEERWLGAAGHSSIYRERSGHSGLAHTRACPSLAQATLSATTPEMFRGARAEAFHRLQRATKFTQFGGDCYAYGLVASGHADLVVEAKMDWHDYLAIVPVIEGAGGVMTDWSGQPLKLGSGDEVIAAGDAGVHAAALELLAKR